MSIDDIDLRILDMLQRNGKLSQAKIAGAVGLTTPSMAAALQVLDRDGPVDLLLSDVILPGPNGRELANAALTKRPRLKVLFMTGYSRNAIVHQGRLDEGVQLIQKPLTQASLAAKVRDVLDLRMPAPE